MGQFINVEVSQWGNYQCMGRRGAGWIKGTPRHAQRKFSEIQVLRCKENAFEGSKLRY